MDEAKDGNLDRDHCGDGAACGSGTDLPHLPGGAAPGTGGGQRQLPRDLRKGAARAERGNSSAPLDKRCRFAIINRYSVCERAGIGRQASLRCLCP